MSEKLTFLLPVKLPAPFLEETLVSIRGQDCDRWQLTVVFDGPSGDAAALVKKLIPADKLTVLSAAGGTGISVGLNSGLAFVRTKYVARIDADDICHPTRVRELLRAFESKPQALVAFSAARIIDETGSVVGNIPVPVDSDIARSLTRRNVITHSAVAFKADEVRGAGGYNRSCDAIEDYDLWLRLARYGEFCAIARELVDYRISEGQVSRRPGGRLARLHVVAGQLELGTRIGTPVIPGVVRSLMWAFGQEPFVRNRFGRLRHVRD